MVSSENLQENLQVISRRAEEQRERLTTEESIKTALVLPLLEALGYDFHNPSEVAAELSADTGTKTSEKVDYAIMRDGKPIILFECKPLGNPMGAAQISQLTRYFNNTDAVIGVLTNGILYKFFTDLDKINIMDQSPFLQVDISNADQRDVAELQRFAKGRFDPDETKDAAKNAIAEAKVIRDVKAKLGEMYNDPDDEFSKALTGDVRNVFGVGRATQSLMERVRPLVKRAFHEFVREHSSAQSSGEFPQETIPSASQSAPNQAPSAIVPPSPSPNAPTSGWQSLSDIQPEQGDDNPTQMMFPDNSEIPITRWTQVTTEAVRWLTDKGHLDKSHCPIPRTPTRHLVATQPIHPDGRDFSFPREVNSLYIEMVGYDAPTRVRNTRAIIERLGMDASRFKVRW